MFADTKAFRHLGSARTAKPPPGTPRAQPRR